MASQPYPGRVPTRARDRLLDTAEELFYAQGAAATGVEQILEASGVGRASFYRHFAGKEELELAVLAQRRRRWATEFVPRVRALGGHPLDVFDVLAARLEETGFRGCAFLNAMVEVPDPQAAVHRVAVDQKEDQQRFFADLLAEHGYPDPDGRLAARLQLLYDGASVTGIRERSGLPALEAREMAQLLLERAAGQVDGRRVAGS